MILRPPRSTRTDTLFPYTTLFRSFQQYQYSALKYSQREGGDSPDFLIFHAPASEIVAWADIDRLGPENRTGAQRPLRKLKVNKVARFLKSASKNTIPTSIVVAVDPRAVTFKGQKAVNGNGQAGDRKSTRLNSSH